MIDGMHIDMTGLERYLDELMPKGLRISFRQAFSRTLAVVKRSVVQEYKGMFPGSIYWKDIHMQAFKSGKGGFVDILYTNKFRSKGDPLYKSFIMKILEQGSYKTGERKTAKGYSRGTLKGYHFFQQGVRNSKAGAETQMKAELEKAMQKVIAKAAR